ncbi:hypothetical protein RYZ27_05635 [Hyphomonas sp. FCG-A18]|uniref:hypothetical protein n=1 Tax=Hyphomonas sp. FCG-A18 TaxID=3080019 RepID=UPI002B293822|nr:hypothetical protein RYZ27_05635 [Hyphomonas sp. FCG-A18]
MTRRTKTLLIVLTGFLVAVFIIIATAFSLGADPFHERSRHIWALSLVAALYVAARGGVMLERHLHRRSQGVDPTLPGLNARSFWRGNHAIDRRMAARRERVEAAREKAKENETKNEGSGDE